MFRRLRSVRQRLAIRSVGSIGWVSFAHAQDPVQQTTFRSFEAYDPATDSWSVLTPMAIARHGAAAAVVGNRFYAVGGDVQSSGTGVEVSTPVVSAFEFSR